MMFNKLVLVLYAIFQIGVCSNCSIKLIIITPNHHTDTPSASWERGVEILPRAEDAVKNINDCEHILPRCKLTITTSSGQCDEETFLNLENVVRHPNLAVVKQFCSNAVGVAVGPIQKRKIASILPQYSHDSELVDALLTLFKQMGWKRIGIVTELSETFFLHVAEAVYKRLVDYSNTTAALFTQLNHHESFNIEQQPKVILISISASKAIELLCQGYANAQQWPKHIWILHSYWLEDFLRNSKQSMCNLQNAMEGILLVRHKITAEPGDVSLSSGYSYKKYQHQHQAKLSGCYNATLKPNPFADVLYNAVWTAALALNNSVDGITAQFPFHTRIPLSFAGALGHCQPKLNISHSTSSAIEIIQVKRCRESQVGIYTTQLRKVMFTNITFINGSPSDQLPVHVKGGSTAYTVGLAFEIVVSTLMVTCFLFLYIVYRNEPEIKSTSISLSLFMFFGCYLILVYLILLLLSDQPNDTVDLSFYAHLCILLQWTSGLGIPVPIIVATLLIKLIRIYYIFNKFAATGPAPVGKQWSDTFLALLVIVTISPNLLILIIWTASDTYTIKLHYSLQNQEYIEVDKQCDSDHLLIWIACWIAYLMFLLIALVVVAFKTRKVRLRHYKDTKKVNAFIFILNLNIFFTVSYWVLLRFITKRHISGIISHIGHSALVILCQALLFAPKVFPPLWRSLSKKNDTL
jgi:hypothetical protein